MSETRPWGVLLIAVFFAAATLVLVAVGTALLLPGSKLEAVWTLYPARRALLMPYRAWLGPGFLLLSAAMASAGAGCLLHRRWGWWLSAAIFAANGVGDMAQLLMGRVLEGGVGVAVTAAVLIYLSRPAVRAAFA
jgi:hypothetical protein